jgi:hypothetical protein
MTAGREDREGVAGPTIEADQGADAEETHTEFVMPLLDIVSPVHFCR